MMFLRVPNFLVGRELRVPATEIEKRIARTDFAPWRSIYLVGKKLIFNLCCPTFTSKLLDITRPP